MNETIPGWTQVRFEGTVTIPKKEYELLKRFKRALYACTPGMGSECIDDPEFCAKRIDDSWSREHRMMIAAVKARKEIEGSQS